MGLPCWREQRWSQNSLIAWKLIFGGWKGFGFRRRWCLICCRGCPWRPMKRRSRAICAFGAMRPAGGWIWWPGPRQCPPLHQRRRELPDRAGNRCWKGRWIDRAWSTSRNRCPVVADFSKPWSDRWSSGPRPVMPDRSEALAAPCGSARFSPFRCNYRPCQRRCCRTFWAKWSMLDCGPRRPRCPCPVSGAWGDGERPEAA